MKIKQILIIISVAIIFSIIGYSLRFTQTGSFKSVLESSEEHHSPPSVVIEPGSGVETASYIIFKDDEGWVYAKSGDTGSIVKSSDNASEVINWAISQLERGKVFIKAGDYNITSASIIFDGEGDGKQIIFEGEGRRATVLYSSGTNNLITLKRSCRVVLRGLTLAYPQKAPSGHAIYSEWYDDEHASVLDSTIENIQFNGVDSSHWNIYLVNPFHSIIRDIRTYGGNGIKLENNGTVNYGNIELSGNIKIDLIHDDEIALYLTNSPGSVHHMNLVHGGGMIQVFPNVIPRPINLTGVLIENSHWNSFDYLLLEGIKTGIKLQNGAHDNEFRGKLLSSIEDGGTAFEVCDNCINNIFQGFRLGSESGNYYNVLNDANEMTQAPNKFIDIFCGATVSGTPIAKTGATIIHRMKGALKSENNGIVTGTSPIPPVAHGLLNTPKFVQLTPNEATAYAISYTADDTNIYIYHNKGSSATISWYAEV